MLIIVIAFIKFSRRNQIFPHDHFGLPGLQAKRFSIYNDLKEEVSFGGIEGVANDSPIRLISEQDTEIISKKTKQDSLTLFKTCLELIKGAFHIFQVYGCYRTQSEQWSGIIWQFFQLSGANCEHFYLCLVFIDEMQEYLYLPRRKGRGNFFCVPFYFEIQQMFGP